MTQIEEKQRRYEEENNFSPGGKCWEM